MDSHKKKSKGIRRSKRLYDTSVILLKIHRSMIKDLQPLEASWFSDPRNYVGPIYENWTSYDYKKMCQLEHLFKRTVLPTDEDQKTVETRSLRTFIECQSTFGIRRRTLRSNLVVQRAREIISGIIGEFDYHEFFSMCKFGKKAAKGLKLKESYLDVRVDRLNGSKEQIEWFKAALCDDIHLHRAVRRGLKKAQIVASLDVNAVPKAFDKKRIILPDSTIGGFLSTGLGRLLRKLLEVSTHIKLAKAQNKHRHLAKASSVSGANATLDMKRASDSFVWEHITMLLPESWWPVLEVVRTPLAKVKFPDGHEESIELGSYMLMGSGHTFPLQSILFYAISKAVLELLGSRARVWVYGDDIILPSKFASYVIDLFDDLGFTINTNKSFVDGPFRESCGGDYHRGIDVRPFMPEHICSHVGAKEYTQFLHKLYNGLLFNDKLDDEVQIRWEYEEIPETLDLILNEILSVWGELYPIPQEWPDGEGVKYIPLKYGSLSRKAVYQDGVWRYFVLSSKADRRKPHAERIYYWCWLHGRKSDSGWTEDPLKWDAEGNGLLDNTGQEPVKGSSKLCWITK